jgi:hypothetical protein
MKSWLRDDRVYQAIMSGALWIVVIAALSTTKWPELGWLTGSITAVLVVIVSTVYWIAVVTNDTDKPNSTAHRQSTQLATVEDAQGGQDVSRQERHSPPQRREEIAEAYLSELSKNLEILRNKNLEVLRDKTADVLRRRVSWDIAETYNDRIFLTTKFDELLLRNWVLHQPHHGAHHLPKSDRRAMAARILAARGGGVEEGSGKVVVMVGSLRIEIQENDPNKTTNVHITSPKTLVANVTDTEEERSRQKPQERGQQKRASTTIH